LSNIIFFPSIAIIPASDILENSREREGLATPKESASCSLVKGIFRVSDLCFTLKFKRYPAIFC